MERMIPDKLQQIFETVFTIKYAVSESMKRDDIKEWDSVNHLNLIVEIEDIYGVSFSIDEIEKISSIADILKKINK